MASSGKDVTALRNGYYSEQNEIVGKLMKPGNPELGEPAYLDTQMKEMQIAQFDSLPAVSKKNDQGQIIVEGKDAYNNSKMHYRNKMRIKVFNALMSDHAVYGELHDNINNAQTHYNTKGSLEGLGGGATTPAPTAETTSKTTPETTTETTDQQFSSVVSTPLADLENKIVDQQGYGFTRESKGPKKGVEKIRHSKADALKKSLKEGERLANRYLQDTMVGKKRKFTHMKQVIDYFRANPEELERRGSNQFKHYIITQIQKGTGTR